MLACWEESRDHDIRRSLIGQDVCEMASSPRYISRLEHSEIERREDVPQLLSINSGRSSVSKVAKANRNADWKVPMP